ncbi:MAG: TerB family tellurite resistance protein [Pseudomonadota bacterium]
MFDRLQKFIQTMGGEDDEKELTRDDPRVAAAALFFHVIDADGVAEPSEREKLRNLLEQEYSLDKNELKKLMDAGKQAEDESVDFYSFTSVLKRTLDAEQRVSFIELMWEMVYADGVRHELEDNIVWRVAELLGVSDRDRVLMRQRVAERVGSGDRG